MFQPSERQLVPTARKLSDSAMTGALFESHSPIVRSRYYFNDGFSSISDTQQVFPLAIVTFEAHPLRDPEGRERSCQFVKLP